MGWVEIRQAQLAKEAVKTQKEILRLQQEEQQRRIERANADRLNARVDREDREVALAAQAAAATLPPPPPGSDPIARVAELEEKVAALEARVQWCIDVIQAQNG